VAKVATVTLVDQAQSVGSLRSRQGVVLRPEVAGRVKAILFADGQRVGKGQLLVQLDDQLQSAQLAQARAEMAIAQANHKRNQELVAQNFISQRSLDESAAALEVARAKHELAAATLQRLKIVAPFDGVAGLRQVNVGDYLKDGADIVNIEDIDAVLVDFRLPERLQSKIRTGQSAQLSIDALPGRPVTALVQAVDPLIDANGRSVGVRGCIDNRQRQLRPGMFARVTTVFGVNDQALVVPEEAIVPQGGRAFVVKLVPGEQPGSLVSQRVAVKTGVRQPGKVEIVEGLSAEDTVVTADHAHGRAVLLQALVAGSDHRVIGLQAFGDFHLARLTHTGLDGHTLGHQGVGLVARHHLDHEGPAALRHDGFFGHGQGVFAHTKDGVDAGEHARAQLALAVVDAAAHADRAAIGVDQRVHSLHQRGEGPPRQRIHVQLGF
jgi:RND family efflux transporter MFP subunit